MLFLLVSLVLKDQTFCLGFQKSCFNTQFFKSLTRVCYLILFSLGKLADQLAEAGHEIVSLSVEVLF